MTTSLAVFSTAVILGLAIVAVVVVRWRARVFETPITAENSRIDWAQDDAVAELVDRDIDVSWPKMCGRTSGILDDDTRLRLINDLAFVRAPWCVVILQRAYEEEREPAIRHAAQTALIACSKAAGAPSNVSATDIH
jgi:hypothetical protein